MPKLNDHGLGGGGRGLGVPIYPFETREGYVTSDNGSILAIYGDAITTIPAASYSNCGCAIGDEIYLIGMMDDDSACYKYNVKTKVWTKLTSSPYDGQKTWAVAYGTDIYYALAGAQSIYKYDTLSNAHSVLISTTTHQMAYSRATIDGDYIYVFGGNATSTYRTYGTRIDIINKAYTRLAAIPTEMYNHSVVDGGDGYIYLFGGQANSTAAYKYSIADNAYTAISALPFNSYGTMIGRKDNLIHLINSVHSLYKNAFYVYDILTGTYTSVGSTPNARQYGITGVVDGVIYMIGGGTSSTTYKSGESVRVVKGALVNLTLQRLIRGVKLYTDGEVNSGVASVSQNTIIFERDTILEKINGAAMIPSDGEYALVDATYATIGG